MLAALLLQSGFQFAGETGGKGEYIVYVGTYTRGEESRGPSAKSDGIYAYRFQPATGKTVRLGLAARTENPSFLVVHPNHRFLYAVNEVSDYTDPRPSSVNAFSIDDEITGYAGQGSISSFSVDVGTGKLTVLNTVSSRGAGPCHLSLGKSGNWLMVANYDSGSIAGFPVKDDGELGDATGFMQHRGSSVDRERQQEPHAHCILPSPDNHFALVADLGLDEILVYRVDAAKGTYAPNDPPFTKVAPGSGPRHLAFHPNGRFLYEISEMKPAVTAFAYDSSRGSLAELQTMQLLPEGSKERGSGAEVEVHPSGRFLYGSIRGLNSIAVLAIDGKGTLELLEYVPTQGSTPRHFAIDPTGAYLFVENQESDNIVLFRIDQRTGRLIPTGTVLDVPTPVCIAFLSAN